MYKKICKKIVCIYSAITLTWMTMFYPELCFNELTCRQIIEEAGEQKVMVPEDLRGFLLADGDTVEISSELYELIKKCFENMVMRNEDRYDEYRGNT